jgi:exosortase/archaeosortase family protein
LEQAFTWSAVGNNANNSTTISGLRVPLLDRSAQVKRKFPIHWARNPIPPLFEKVRREPAAAALLVALSAICIDYVVAPVLNTVTPALACVLFVILILRRDRAASLPEQSPDHHPLTAPRVLFFLLLHAVLVAVAWKASKSTASTMPAIRIPQWAVAAAKYLVLLPAIVLLPWKQWQNLARTYRHELLASIVALATVDPYRIFATAWPWYCQVLGRFAHALARPFVAGLAYVPLPTPTLSGPTLDVHIVFACSGLEAIKLFQIVFAFMLVLDWTYLHKSRTLIAYFAGMAAMLAANAVRIALLAITGNLAPRLAIQHHLTLGWIFFACVAALLIVPLYGWVMPRRAPIVLATI